MKFCKVAVLYIAFLYSWADRWLPHKLNAILAVEDNEEKNYVWFCGLDKESAYSSHALQSLLNNHTTE